MESVSAESQVGQMSGQGHAGRATSARKSSDREIVTGFGGSCELKLTFDTGGCRRALIDWLRLQSLFQNLHV